MKAEMKLFFFFMQKLKLYSSQTPKLTGRKDSIFESHDIEKWNGPVEGNQNQQRPARK